MIIIGTYYKAYNILGMVLYGTTIISQLNSSGKLNRIKNIKSKYKLIT
jgi:hypothetical protein